MERTKRKRARVGRKRARGRRKIQVVGEAYLLSSVDSPLLDLHALVKRNIRVNLCGVWTETFE